MNISFRCSEGTVSWSRTIFAPFRSGRSGRRALQRAARVSVLAPGATWTAWVGRSATSRLPNKTCAWEWRSNATKKPKRFVLQRNNYFIFFIECWVLSSVNLDEKLHLSNLNIQENIGLLFLAEPEIVQPYFELMLLSKIDVPMRPQ